MFYTRTDSPKAKQNVRSSIGNFLYQFLPELPTDLTVMNLENKELLVTSQIWLET